MGHLFQANCWEKHPSVGVHLVYMDKEMKRKRGINWYFINENNGNYEK